MSALFGGTYSFLDVVATLTGPGAAAVPLGNGAGIHDDGITVEFEEDQNTMTTGADGTVMNALKATRRGHCIVRVMKTSPTNAFLSLLFNFQKQSSANWGQNLIVVSDLVRGDLYRCALAAFAKYPSITWSKEGMVLNEWRFHVGDIEPLLGLGFLPPNNA